MKKLKIVIPALLGIFPGPVHPFSEHIITSHSAWLSSLSEEVGGFPPSHSLSGGSLSGLKWRTKSSLISSTAGTRSQRSLLNIRGGATQEPVATAKKVQKATGSGSGGIFGGLVPISTSELPQFLATSLMMFFFIFVFTTVRDTKDTLVVTKCGAEAIPFLKLYGVLPAATAFIVTYSKLSNILSRKALFYVTLIPFFVFYSLFAFVAFPARDVIHFLPGIDTVQVHPAVALLRYWSFSLYFIVSELWASAGVPLLFWQCANDVTNLQQAKRFYPLFAVIGNLAPIASGKTMSAIVSRQTTNDDAGFGTTLKTLALVKVSVCVCIITLYQVVNSMASKAKAALAGAVSSPKKQPTKKKPSFAESMTELSKSKELRSMATMVVCYNVCIELSEVLWKGILRKNYPNKADYMSFMAGFSQTVGMVSLVLQISASSIIHVLGWKNAALVTPLAMGALALPFFLSVGAGEKLVPAAVAFLIGTTQNVVSKATKYALFDPCKEMAYIPLGPDARVKGKAAVDVLGARMGRSIGSASQQIMVLFAGGNILRCAGPLGMLYLFAVIIWSRAVTALSKLFDKHSETCE